MTSEGVYLCGWRSSATPTADPILWGHTHTPLVQPTELPNGRMALAVRGHGVHAKGDPVAYWVVYVILTHRGARLSLGFAEWEITLGAVPWQPRDASWTWDQPSGRSGQSDRT